MIVVLIGPPGSGKSTQGHLISNEYQWPFVGVGDLVREMIHSNNEYESKVNSGNLLPDEIVFGIVKEELDKMDLSNGLVLEGYPRTTGQAVLLDKYLKQNKQVLSVVLYLNNVHEQVISDRIAGRYQCPSCGNTYSKEEVPTDFVCSKCGSKVVPREDDTASSLLCRMKEYQKKSLPVCAYYNDTNRLCAVDASHSIEEVFSSARECLKNRREM